MQETNGNVKLSEVSAALSVPLQQQCSCSLSVQQSLFSCLGTTDSQVVVFLAQLSYTALPGVDMPSLVTSWVSATPRIAVASTQLQVDSTCPVVIDFLQHESCTAATIAPPTEPPSDVTVVVVAVCVCATLVVVTVIIVIAVTVFCRKQSKYRCVLMLFLYIYIYMTSCEQLAYSFGSWYMCCYIYIYILVVFIACCADPTVQSPTRCIVSVTIRTVHLGVWCWLI